MGEGEGGMMWENGIETCKISCMKRVASPSSMHNTGCLGLVHWDDPEGWNGEGGGTRVQDGEHLPGDLPDPGMEPLFLVSPALVGRFFTTFATWEAIIKVTSLDGCHTVSEC